jgi:hypothetical protein
MCPPHTAVMQLTYEQTDWCAEARCTTDVASFEGSVIRLQVQMQPSKGANAVQQCVCREGYFTMQSSKNEALPCRACPDGAVCAGGDLWPVAQAGYGQLAHANTLKPPEFFPCPFGEKSCLGGTITGSLGVPTVVHVYQCHEGHTDYSSLCSRCEPGFGMQKNACAKCTIKGLPILILCLLFVLLWFPLLRDVATKRVRSL